MSRRSAKRIKPLMPAKKLQQIMKSVKDEIEQQVDPVVEELQSRLNEPYFLGYMEHKLKYDPGQAIIFLFEGWYYSGLIDKVYRMTEPASIYPDGAPEDHRRRIPSYLFHFLNSPHTAALRTRTLDAADGMMNELPENEFIPRGTRDPDAAFGSLVCDLWNKTRKNLLVERGLEELVPTVKTGVWLLDDENYKEHEQAWQKQSGENRSFEQFCSDLCSEEQ